MSGAWRCFHAPDIRAICVFPVIGRSFARCGQRTPGTIQGYAPYPIKFVGRRPSPAKRNTGLANKLEKARRRAEATEVIQDSEEDDIIPGLGGEEHAGGQTDNVE